MAGTAVPGRLTWRLATVRAVVAETPRTATLELEVPGWPGHRAGQHVDVRLTAEDGYQAERSYSIASASDGERIALTIERLDNGEVSPYLTEELRPGDRFELRGPIGGYFVWTPADGGPLVLIGGGSGIVPLMAILRTQALARSEVPVRLLGSFRSRDEIIYREEIEGIAAGSPVSVAWTLTRSQLSGWTGYRRRIDAAMLSDVAGSVAERPIAYICGPTPFVERAASILVELGHDPARVRTERFGPSGG